jgi:hypothetical protein
MADNIEAILLRLGLDASGFTKGARDARKEMGLMEKGVGSLRSSIGGLAGQLAAGLGVAVLAREALQFAESVTKVHEQTGLAISSIQFLRLAADQTGTSVDSLAGLVNKMQRQLVEAGNNDKLAQQFTDMGLSVEQLRTQRPEEQLDSIAKAIAAINDPAERSTAAVAAFGKSGADAIPELVALAEQSDVLTEAFQRTGGAVSDEAIAQVEGLGDAMGQVKVAVVALATELLGQAAPALTSFLETTTKVVAGLRLLDGEGDNAMVNLDSKIRAAAQELNTLRINAENGMVALNGTPIQAAIAAQEQLVAKLREEYDVLAGLGTAGASRAKQEKAFQDLLAQGATDAATALTASLESDLAIRAAFGELRYEQDTALEQRLFEMREAARQRELDAMMEAQREQTDFEIGLQEQTDSILGASMEEAKDLKITTMEQETAGIFQLLEAQTAGVSRHSKAMFEINKAAGIVNTVINTIQAVVGAWKDYGWPVGAVIGAAIAAAGAAQVQAIASTKFGSKTAPSQAAAPATPTAPAAGGGGGGGGVLRVEGISGDQMMNAVSTRALVSRIIEAQKDGHTVVLAQ